MNPKNMHQYGIELIKLGFSHVVAINNYYHGIGPDRRFINVSMDFTSDTEIAEHGPELTMILIKHPKEM